MPTTFETTDLDAADRFLNATYGPVRLAGAGPDHFLRVTRHPLGRLQLHRVTFRMRCTAEGGPLGMLGFGRLAGGSVAVAGAGGRRTHQTPGEVYLVELPDREYGATVRDADVELAFLDPDLLAQVADAAPGRAARPVAFTGYRPVSRAGAHLWSSTYDYVRDTLTAGPAAEDELLVGSAGRLLAATALAAFPNNAMHEPTAGDRRDAHPATMRRAVGFIDDNAHRDIGPAEVAAAAGVTIRALQLAFRRHLETTPMGYLRRVRLEHAHRELLAGTPAGTSIQAVAARWGFGNHSRFTALYRATYGLTPSRTLHHG